MQSLNNKLHILQSLLEDKNNFIALCLTETWLSVEKIPLINCNGYNLASWYCRRNYAGGGTCIFLKKELAFDERNDLVSLSIEYIIEVSAIIVTKLNLLLIVIYWNGRQPDIFYDQLLKLLKLLVTKYNSLKIVIGGDFNVNILGNDQQTSRLLNQMLEFNFRNHINQATRVTRSTSTCLDLIFTNFSENLFTTQVYDYGFSDHKSTIIKITKHLSIRKTWTLKKRHFNKQNILLFQNELKKIDWSTIIKSEKNINTNYNNFNTKITEILNLCIPLKIKQIRLKQKQKWITRGIHTSCKNKRNLKILVSYTKNKQLIQHYKLYTKLLKKAVNRSKKLLYIAEMKNSENKTKSMWRIIRERTNKNQQKLFQGISLNIHNNLTSDPMRVANGLNDYFASIGKLNGTSSTRPCGRPVIQPTDNTIYLRPVEPRETYLILRNLKNKHSYGIDELPPVLLRFCAKELTLPYYQLINQSFLEGTFPDLLKISIVKPIHKKGSKLDPNNYRPIALLPTSSKIFEKAMQTRLNSFCEKYNIFDDSQNGFRKNRSTVLATYKYIQEILNLINDKFYAIGILLDMTKAYDKVQFNILLDKLYGIGIRGLAHSWFKSYLYNREQYVEVENFDEKTGKIEKIRSNPIKINNSIPQGSVIGCILFLIYINDLPKCITQSCILFADDISLLTSCKNDINLNNNISDIFNDISSWMTDHNLDINYTKTKIMQFRPYQKTPLDIHLTYNNITLESVDTFTLLGLDIDVHLNWKSHINKIRSKLSSFTYALSELRKATDLKTCLSAYYAYAFAWLRYGIILWGASVDAQDLFISQKKCIRILTNTKIPDSCTPHFRALKILTLVSIYILEISKFVRKYPIFFHKVNDQPRRYQSRHKHNLVIPTSKLKMHKNSPHSMAVKIYNKIPEKIKSQENNKIFEYRLKEMLIKKCYYELDDFFSDKFSDP